MRCFRAPACGRQANDAPPSSQVIGAFDYRKRWEKHVCRLVRFLRIRD